MNKLCMGCGFEMSEDSEHEACCECVLEAVAGRSTQLINDLRKEADELEKGGHVSLVAKEKRSVAKRIERALG